MDSTIQHLTHWLQTTEIWGNSLVAWGYALAAAIISWLIISWILRISSKQLSARLEHIHASRARNSLNLALALLRSTRRWLVLLLVITLALKSLKIAGSAHVLGKTKAGTLVLGTPETMLVHIVFAICAIQAAFWIIALIRIWIEEKLIANNPENANVVLLGMLSWFLKLVVWTIVLLAVLANLGMNITAFIASLGVGGIAIALGLQTMLKDVFASLAIGLDKPYKVGEFIMFGSILGTVTKVGARSVRLDSLSGEELSISNSNLASQLVHNYSRMPRRRIVFDFSVPYLTPAKHLETIVTKVHEFLDDEKQAAYDRGHFIAFGQSGYDLEFVYNVTDSNFALYRDIQQRVNFKTIALLEELGVDFALPTRRLQVSQQPGQENQAALAAQALLAQSVSSGAD